METAVMSYITRNKAQHETCLACNNPSIRIYNVLISSLDYLLCTWHGAFAYEWKKQNYIPRFTQRS